jgi:hypothetical protein
MKVSPTKATTVISRLGRAIQPSLGRERRGFRDNTYNKDSYLDEADMNS